MTGKPLWEETSITDGFAEVRVRSWRNFINYIQKEMLNYHSYIWRGQRCDEWPLESTLDRLREKAKINNTKSFRFNQKHLEQFKYAVRGRRGPNPPKIENENDW